MEHFTTFLILVAVVSATAAVTLTLMLRQQYHHHASLWFAAAMAGLGCFLLEILIWRYARILRPVLSVTTFDSIVAFSKFWAVVAGVLLTMAMPRLARLMTGSPHGIAWKIADLALPALTFAVGVVLITGVGGAVTVIVLQLLIFGSSATALLLIALLRQGDGSSGERRLLRRLAIWSALCLPLIILDAVAALLPPVFNDLPLTLFVLGVCLISTFEARQLFGSPTYLNAGVPSNHFLQRFGISPREAELVTLVIEGTSNLRIAERLFISEKTVENHLTSIFRKTAVKNRIQLFRLIHASSD